MEICSHKVKKVYTYLICSVRSDKWVHALVFIHFFRSHIKFMCHYACVRSFCIHTHSRWSENRYWNFQWNSIVRSALLFVHTCVCVSEWYGGKERNPTVQFKQECLHKWMNEFSPFEKKQQHVRVHTQLKICDFRSKLLCGWQQKQKHSSNITYIAHVI